MKKKNKELYLLGFSGYMNFFSFLTIIVLIIIFLLIHTVLFKDNQLLYTKIFEIV